VAAPAAHAASYTISARGSATGFGRVTAIGDFKPDRDPTLGAAIRAFGRPSSIRERTRTSCPAGWRALGLRIGFVNLGGGGSACVSSLGKAQSVSAFGRRWRTSRGLKVGDSTRRLRRLYPHALRRGRTYRLVGAKSIFTDGSRYSVLAAKTSAGKVRSFRLFIGAAGE
jgi:hypothetical protein